MGYLRRLPSFEYVAPKTIAAVCDALAAHPTEARLLAGGTDLILQLRRREIRPRYVIGLKSISELDFIDERANGELAIGAMTTVQGIQSSALVRKKYPLLAETAAQMGSPEIRQVATIGGNLAGALPCADFPPALLVLGAKVRLQSKQGERLLSLEDFFVKFEQTVARRDEFVTAIYLGAPPLLSGGVYLKFHDRHSMDMTTTGVAAFVSLDRDSRVLSEVKIALGTSAPVPLRARKAEAALRGQRFNEKVLEDAASLACEEAEPRDSWRASRTFRLELIRALTKRAVTDAWKKALATGGTA